MFLRESFNEFGSKKDLLSSLDQRVKKDQNLSEDINMYANKVHESPDRESFVCTGGTEFYQGEKQMPSGI